MVRNDQKLDVVIIGGGPAGLTASLWCRDLGLRSMTFEAGARPGGQLHRIYNPINNYPGILADSGDDLYDRFTSNIASLDEDIFCGRTVVEIDTDDLTVITHGGEELSARALVLATGVRRRKLGIPGEDEFVGRGILGSGAKERRTAAGRVVAVVGSGDAALENAVILSEHAERVIVIHRRKELSARPSFVEQAAARSNVEFVAEAEVTAITGGESVNKIELIDRAAGRETTLDIDMLLIRIGVEPNSDLLKGKAELDNAGYVRVDSLGRTSLPWIYAIGDLANPVSPTIVSAAGSGATAIKAIARDILAAR